MPELTRDYEELRMPTYVAVDVSHSMASSSGGLLTPWEASNDGLQMIANTILVGDPELRDLCLLGVVTFNSEARVHRPLLADGPVSIEALPKPTGQTDFRKLFEVLDTTIHEDLAALKRRKVAIKRPAVFLLSDGKPYVGGSQQPRAEYLPAVHALHSREVQTLRGLRSIAVVPFGFGSADARALCDARSRDMRAYLAPAHVTGDIVSAIMKAILSSIVASASSPELVIRPPKGVTVLDCQP